MKNEKVSPASAEIAFGALAGIIGGFALAGAAQSLYSLTSLRKIAAETAVEPRDPFIVLAEKAGKLTGQNLNESQKKVFEQGVATVLSATTGVSYVLLARKWKLNWLAGGAVFGGLFWVVSMLLAGYFLGGLVEQFARSVFGVENFLLEDHIDKVVIIVVLLSILPIVYEYIKARREKKLEMVNAVVEPKA